MALLPLAGAQQDVLHLKRGETIEGRLAGKNAGFIEIIEDSGSVIRRFAPDDVVRIVFADAPELATLRDKAAYLPAATKIEQLERIARRRTPLLGSLQPSDERTLTDLLDLYLQDDRNLEALSYAKLWHPKISYEENAERLEEQLIVAALQANLPGEAQIHAESWIARRPPSSTSAIAWHVAAETKLKAGDPEAALWLSLQPIAFSGEPAPRHLAFCYQTAIAASLALEAGDYAERLRAESQARFPDQNEPVHSASTEFSSEPPPPDLPSLVRPNLLFSQLLKNQSPQSPHQ